MEADAHLGFALFKQQSRVPLKLDVGLGVSTVIDVCLSLSLSLMPPHTLSLKPRAGHVPGWLRMVFVRIQTTL